MSNHIVGTTPGIGRPPPLPAANPTITFQIHLDVDRIVLREVQSDGGGVGQREGTSIALDDLFRDIIAAQQRRPTPDGAERGYFKLEDLRRTVGPGFLRPDGTPAGNNDAEGFVCAVLIGIGFVEVVPDIPGRYRLR